MRRIGALLTAMACLADASTGVAQEVRGELRSRGRPLIDAVVFLEVIGDSAPVPAPIRGRLDQRNLAFSPRILLVPPGSTVEFPNNDSVMHNVFHPGEGTEAFDLGTYASSEAKSFRFDRQGLFVVLCHVHPEMVAYVAVVPSALHTVTDSDGRFTLGVVPAGSYRLHVWHRRVQDPSQAIAVTRGAQQEPIVLELARRPRRGSVR